MKKLITTTALIFTIYLTARSQDGLHPPVKQTKPDTCQIIFDKPTAIIILRGLQTSSSLLPGSETISAKASTEAQQVSYYFIQAIYRRWPDLNAQAKK
jgi:hypothetical protein